MNQLKAGAILSYMSIFITIIVTLIYTPIIIRLLGQSEYGLYALIGSLAAYFSILDLGLGNTIVRYISRSRAAGSSNKEASLNGTFLILYSIIGFLTLIIGLIVLFNVERIFASSLTYEELSKAKVMIVILIFNFAISFPLSVFNSIIKAYEKFVIDKLISISRIILGPLLTLPFLFLGYGSVTMVLITTVVNISCLIFAAGYAIKKLHISFSFAKVENSLLKEIFGYSFFIFLNIIVDQIFWKTDQVILGVITSTATVAVYAIGMQFISLYMQFSTAISNLLLPRLSRMVIEDANENDFTNIMIRFGRLQFLLIGYILAGFYIFGQYFLEIWVGNTYQDAYIIVLIIMIPLTIPLIQNIGITVLQALNKLAFRSILYTILAVINIIISVPLATLYGGIGPAIATSFSLLVGHIFIMNIYYSKSIGINIILFWKNIFFLLIPLIISIILGRLLTKLIPLDTIFNFVLGIILFTIIYIIINWLIGMNSYEKNILLSFKKKLNK